MFHAWALSAGAVFISRLWRFSRRRGRELRNWHGRECRRQDPKGIHAGCDEARVPALPDQLTSGLTDRGPGLLIGNQPAPSRSPPRSGRTAAGNTRVLSGPFESGELPALRPRPVAVGAAEIRICGTAPAEARPHASRRHRAPADFRSYTRANVIKALKHLTGARPLPPVG